MSLIINFSSFSAGFSDDPVLPFGISAWDLLGVIHLSFYAVIYIIATSWTPMDLFPIYARVSKKGIKPSVSHSFLSKAYFLIWLSCVQHSFPIRNPTAASSLGELSAPSEFLLRWEKKSRLQKFRERSLLCNQNTASPVRKEKTCICIYVHTHKRNMYVYTHT